MKIRLKTAITASLGVYVMLLSATAHAEPYPSQLIRIIVPTSAGGTTDLLARLVGNFMATKTGRQVIVENRPGSGGNVGTEAAARAAADGHTLGFVNLGNIAINPALYPKAGFDPLTELIPVAPVGDAPQLLVINGKLPPRTLSEFVSFAKAQPGKLNYASAGLGSTVHLAGHQFLTLAGIDLQHIPYRGTAPATSALLSGEVHMMSVSLGPVAGFVQTGGIRALAAASKQRTAAGMGPAPAIALMKAIAAKDRNAVELVSKELAWANEPLKPIIGDPDIFASYNIQIEKARINAAGYCDCGPCRPPYDHIPDEYAASARECGRRWASLQSKYAGKSEPSRAAMTHRDALKLG